jgi:hypothetical protein
LVGLARRLAPILVHLHLHVFSSNLQLAMPPLSF